MSDVKMANVIDLNMLW